MTIESTGTLSEAEHIELWEREQTIERGLQAFYEVGEALLAIREKRLYRESHTTWNQYLRERWDMGKSQAFYLIQSAETYRAIEDHSSTIVELGSSPILPTTENQARELTPLPPDERPQAWREAVEKAGGQPTAEDVKSVVRERKAPSATTRVTGDLKELISNMQKSTIISGLESVYDEWSRHRELIEQLPDDDVTHFLDNLRKGRTALSRLITLVEGERK